MSPITMFFWWRLSRSSKNLEPRERSVYHTVLSLSTLPVNLFILHLFPHSQPHPYLSSHHLSYPHTLYLMSSHTPPPFCGARLCVGAAKDRLVWMRAQIRGRFNKPPHVTARRQCVKPRGRFRHIQSLATNPNLHCNWNPKTRALHPPQKPLCQDRAETH